MSLFRKVVYPVCLILLAVLVSACTASSRVVRTYEGDALAANQVARLVAPEDIEVMEINGIKQTKYLLENLALTYELTPGRHTIVYKYAGLWSVPRSTDAVGDEEAGKAKVVNSELRQATFVFKAGETYTFSFARPDSREEALEFARNFSAVIVNDGGQSVAKDAKYVKSMPVTASAGTPVQQTPTAFPVTPSVSTQAPATPGNVATPGATAIPAAPVDAGLSRLEALKVLWGKASAEEKKEFLRWAFQ